MSYPMEKLARLHGVIGHYLPPLPEVADLGWWNDFVAYIIKINPQAYLESVAILSDITFQDIIKLDAETILMEFIRNMLESRYADFVRFIDGLVKYDR